MICSSVNRERFIPSALSLDGLYPNLEEVQGLRSLRRNVSADSRGIFYQQSNRTD
jgi:hypothetical protein